MSERTLRFIGVGAGGFALQIAVLHTLVSAGGVPYPLATVLAVESAIVHNFCWHERWTWRDRAGGVDGRLSRLWRFHGATAAISIAGNVALMALLVAHLHLPLVPANALTVAALAAVNYAVADRWVFARPRGLPPERSRTHGAAAGQGIGTFRHY